MSSLVILTGALLASAAHVLTGPDHLAAVVPLAVEHRRKALGIGAAWGLGHGAGVAVLGAIAHVALSQVQLESVSRLCEVLVGVLLVFVGVRALQRSRMVVVHAHGHDHVHVRRHGHVHVHLHVGDRSVGAADHLRRGRHRHLHGALGFGLLHGAAGGSHLIGALPALALPGAGAMLYLGSYLVGAVVTMAVFAFACGRVVPPGALPQALRLSGVAAVGVGVVWVGTTLLVTT